MKTNREIEIKLRVPSAASARRLLRAAGFRVARRRTLEVNTLYDTVDGRLRSGRQLLRVRRYGPRTILTFKGIPQPGKHKAREELEIGLTSAGTCGSILERLGFRPTFRYEKFRTEYRGDSGDGVVTIDETPLGPFLELEGNPGWIDLTAARLGFKEHDYITMSYGALWEEHCRREGLGEVDMLL
jgi:adenylate cyclase class 2